LEQTILSQINSWCNSNKAGGSTPGMILVPHNMSMVNLSICLAISIFKNDALFIALNSHLPNMAANELFQTKCSEDYA